MTCHNFDKILFQGLGYDYRLLPANKVKKKNKEWTNLEINKCQSSCVQTLLITSKKTWSNGALHCIDMTSPSIEEVQLVSIVLVGGRAFADLCSIN